MLQKNTFDDRVILITGGGSGLGKSIGNYLLELGASIIIFTFKKEGFLNLLFVNKLVLRVGLISYSLYLLHYPIFAFVRTNRLAQSSIDYLIVALIIIAYTITDAKGARASNALTYLLYYFSLDGFIFHARIETIIIPMITYISHIFCTVG